MKLVIAFMGHRLVTILVMTVAAVAMALITIFEAVANTGEVPYPLYLSWWFTGLMALACVNLFCNLLAPPWRHRKKVPSLLMHVGFLLIFAGGYFTWTLGIRGSLPVNEGQGMRENFFLKQPVLHAVQNAVDAEGADRQSTIDAPLTGSGRFRCRTLWQALNPVASGSTLTLDNGETVRIETVKPSVMCSAHVKDGTITLTLGARGHLPLSPGSRIEIPHEKVAMLIYETASDTIKTHGQLAETAFVPLIKIEPPASSQSPALFFPVTLQDAVGQTFSQGDYTVKVLQYYPNFKVNQEPDPNDEPLNPTLKLEVTLSGEAPKQMFTFARVPNFHGNNRLANGATVQFTMADPEKTLVFFCDAQGQYTAQLGSDGVPAAFSENTPFFVEDPDGKSPPALKVGLEKAKTSRWLTSGGGRVAAPDSSTVVYIDQSYPLGFKLKLDDAVARFWPASGIARAYYSHVTLQEEGQEPVQVKIETNQPFYKNGFRLYQSDMDNEGTRSGFSVVKDPGFPLVAAGFFMLFAGIIWLFAIRFVIRPINKRNAPRKGN